MLTALALWMCLQEPETIPRGHRDAYQIALLEYEHAVQMIDSEPRKALQHIENVFADKNVGKRDRRIQFERFAQQPVKIFDFYPNQARGRIRMALSKADPNNASSLIAAAIVDFKASADAGIKPSEKLLDDARKTLEKLRAAKTPEPVKESAAEQSFREAWFKLVEDRKFKSARDWVDAKGGALSVDKRRQYVKDTEDRCRGSVFATLDDFVMAMELNARPYLLRQKNPAEFGRLFALPADAELVGAYVELDWARKERALLDKLRASEPRPREDDVAPLLEGLVAQAIASEPFERTAENRWFKASGQMAFRYAEEVVMALVLMSKDAAPEKRRRCHEAAEKLRSKWSEAMAKLPKDFLARNQVLGFPRRLATLLDEFPVDASEVDQIDLDACFIAGSPDSALEHVISDLTKIRDQQGARLSKPSLQKLLTDLVVATAVHEILAGKSTDEVAKGLQELGRSLAQAGGPYDPARWGPKIERIFAALK